MKTLTAVSFRLSHSLSRIKALVIFLLLPIPVSAQQVQPEIRPLVVGEKTTRTVSANEEVHVYAAELKRGQVLQVSFQEKGADVTALIVRAADEQKVSAVSNYGSGFLRESVTLIPERDGFHWLVIRAQRVTETNVEALYEFSVTLKNTSDQNDLQRVKAETLMEEGNMLLAGKDKTASSLAFAKFEQGLKVWNLLGDAYYAEIAKVSMAGALAQAGDFPRAETLLKQVLKTFTDSKDEPGIATLSLSLAGLYIATKNQEAVNLHLRTAIEIFRRLGDKRAESLLGLFGLSDLMIENNPGDFDQDLAAAKAKDDKLAQASVWARTLFRYVIEEDSIEDEDQREFFERAEREAIPLLASIKDRDLELKIFLGLGIGMYDLTFGPNTTEATDLANKKKSIDYTCHALVLAKVQNNVLMQSFAYNHLNLYYDGDNDRLAIFYGKKAINSLQALKQDFRLFDKETQQETVKALDETYSSLASDLFFEGRLGEAQQVLNFSRDQEYFDFKLNQNQEVAKLSLTSRESESEQLFNAALEGIAVKYAKRADAADYRLAGQELKVTLGKLEQNFDAQPSERDIISSVPDTVDMQNALQELNSKTGKKHVALYVVEDVGEVLLITPDTTFAFASSTDIGDLSTYVNSFDMDEYILDFLHTLRSSHLDPRPLGARIYNKIFKTKELVGDKFKQTLEEKLARLKPDVLLWSLTGNIRYVPVAALYDANTGQYLVEKYQNTVFTRARKERFLIEPKAWEQGAGFGTSVGYGKLPPLPDVPNELSKIFGNPATKQEGFFQGQVLLNRAFTRQAMLANMQRRPAFVHIASHFIFQPGNSRNSFLLLGDGNSFSLTEMLQTPNLFAGVDLLTLSACETAGQQPGADGREVDGFAELAQRLGASSVIATLWSIADDGTSEFMTEFYRLRQANPTTPKSEILQRAQLSLLKGKRGVQSSGVRRGDIVGLDKSLTGIPFKPRPESPLEHPYYWAPFVLFGSSR